MVGVVVHNMMYIKILFPFFVLKLRQEDWEFKVSLGIIVKQNKTEQKKFDIQHDVYLT